MAEAEAGELNLDDMIPDATPHASAVPPPSNAPHELLTEAEVEPVHIFQGNFGLNLFAGVFSGLLSILFCVAAALLISSQVPTANSFAHALSITLISATVVGLVIASRSGVAFALAGPESIVALLLFLYLGGVHAALPDTAAPIVARTTLIAATMILTIFVGLCLWTVGGVGNGDWLRFVPIQAIGGMAAGVGFYVIKYTLAFVVGCSGTGMDLLLRLFDESTCLMWIPPTAFGLVLFIAMRLRRGDALILPLMLLAIGGAHAAFFAFGMDLDAARMQGWLFAPMAQDHFWNIYSSSLVHDVDLAAIVGNVGYIVVLTGLILVGTMYKITQMEIALGRDVDINREYLGMGMGNLLTGLLGGVPATYALSRSLSNKALGARGAVAGIIAALTCAGALFGIHYAIAYIPRFVPTGLLLALGLSLMWRWLISTRTQFTHKGDYSLLVLIFLLTCAFGILVGAGIGAALALLVVAGRYGSMSVVKHEMSGATFHSNVDRAPSQFRILKEKGDQIHVIALQGFIFLGTISGLLRHIHSRIRDREHNPLRFLLLDFTFIGGLDSSVALSFTKLQQMARKFSFMLVFTNIPFELEEQLKGAGCILNDPERHSLTVTSLDYALEWAEDHILDAEDALTVDSQPLAELLRPVFPEPRYIPLLMKVLKKVQIKKGTPVFRQGDPSDAMYFIETGMVNVQLELEGGKILRLKKMGPGTAFGEMGIYTSAPRSATIIAAEDCTLYRLSTTVLHKLQAKAPHFTAAIHRFIVNLLSERVADANAKVRDLMT